MSTLEREVLLMEGWMVVMIFTHGFLVVPAGCMVLLHAIRAGRDA
jgi:hypothetical protein